MISKELVTTETTCTHMRIGYCGPRVCKSRRDFSLVMHPTCTMAKALLDLKIYLKMGRAITPQKGHQRRCHITPLCFHGNVPIYGCQTSIYGHVATETEGCYITPPLVTLSGCKYTPHF